MFSKKSVLLLALVLVVAIAEPTLKTDPLDYNPFSTNTTDSLGFKDVSKLFYDEIEFIRLDGPKNPVWKVFSDFMPRSIALSAKKNLSVHHESMRRIFTRAVNADAPPMMRIPFIRSSPLEIKSIRTSPQKGLQSSPTARLIDVSSTLGLRVSEKLTKDLIGEKRFDFDPSGVLANFQAPNELCPFKTNIVCNATNKYPPADGSCNNLASPWLGKSETPYKRYEQPTYDDKLNSPRSKAVNGNPLPNPRVISRLLFNENFEFENSFTHMTASFGQFLAHDITSAAISTDPSGSIINCGCNSNNPSCMSVQMPSNENIMRMSCMQFTRSSAAFASFDCRLGHREQLNLLTPYIDLSQVYGPNAARTRDLRANQRGQMLSSVGPNGQMYLPTAQDGACRNTDSTVKCFAAGEGRTNENLGLTSLQTLFLREHNRIAAELSTRNPSWSDDKTFNEARKIVIAIAQHIVYNEYVPTIVGFNNAGMFDLIPLATKSYYSGYDPSVNPSLAGEFATAAYRFGHTLMRTKLDRVDNAGNAKGTVNLGDIIFRPVEAFNAQAGGLDSILLGLTNEPTSKYDTNFADALQNHLFEVQLSDGTAIAIDLAATNINRGRDHGIATYNTMREKCGLKKATSFADLADSVPPKNIQSLSMVYDDVNDIDLYVGGLSETPVSGGLVGPVFACIISNQFKDLKKGDRFYYENGPSATAFTLDQLSEIKKNSLAKLICNNFAVSQIQPNVFIMPTASLNNKKISCSWLPSMDLSKWSQ